jgi:hypothetical protein
MKKHRPDELTEFLRRGDPAASESMPDHEVAALRARLEEALARRPRPAPQLAWAALAGAAVLALAAVLLLPMRAPQSNVPPASAPAPAAAAAPAAIDRQLQFETASGTRIVWVLSSDLNL